MQTGKVMAIATITTTTLGAAGIVVIAVEGTRITSGAHSANAEIATTKVYDRCPLPCPRPISELLLLILIEAVT